MIDPSNQKINVSFKDVIVEFNNIKANGLSGSVIIQIPGTPGWMLSFLSGKLAGISGGIDAIGRWKRSLALASLNAPLDRLIKSTDREEIFLNSNKFAQEWAIKEVLFDIIQFSQTTQDRLSYQLIGANQNYLKSTATLPLLDIHPLLQATIQSWQEWEQHGLAKFSPSLWPIVRNQDRIAQLNHDRDLQYLLSSIDGNLTLRSLAIHHQKKTIDVAVDLLPLFKAGTIELIRKLDSETVKPSLKTLQQKNGESISQSNPAQNFASDNSILNSVPSRSPLIACIDDSDLVCKSLEKIIVEAGYRCLLIQDPVQILTTLIKNKPDLIFLDLVMPVTNGYEVCEQIRKTPSLANIPTIILTGNDGLIDRVRTKFIGANGFISKPATSESLLKAIDKHIDKSHQIETAVDRRGKYIEQITPASIPGKFTNVYKQILVIDDDKSIREVISMCLNKLKGWDILTAASGAEGLYSVRTHKPDAIVLDIMMPNMDGLAFLRSLRSEIGNADIPVLILTANSHPPGKKQLLELGVVDVISKPFIPVNLVRQIDRVLTEPKLVKC